jgi:hypothetical protein
MATFGGLTAAVVTGGEAVPVFPSFNKVMMLDGTTREPKRIVPVYGLDGRVLFGSDVGIEVDTLEFEDTDDLPAGGPNRVIKYNDPEYHLEGGRVARQKGGEKKGKGVKLATKKRIKQNRTLLRSSHFAAA